MLKRKTIVLLSSVLASASLVGGAVAAFSITDLADPRGFNATMGNLDVDDTTYATLRWGETTELTSLGNLKVNENRKAGVVSLKSSVNYQYGVFSVTMSDVTEPAKAEAAPKMLDYLNVYVYEGNQDLGEQGELPTGESVTLVTSISKNTEKTTSGTKTTSVTAVGTPAGHELSIFVCLDNDASPYSDAIAEDKVYIEVDYSPRSQDVATDSTVYASKGSWSKLYAYAWKDEKVNAKYPGVEMVKAFDDVYQISIPNDMEYVIFNNGQSGEGNQTGNIELSGFTTAKPYWDGEKWDVKPTPEATHEVTAMVNDQAIALNDIKADSSTNIAEYRINLKADDEIEFEDNGAAVHFYHWVEAVAPETEGHAEDDGALYTAQVDGTYVFYYNNQQQMYVEVLPEVAYYLVGTHNDWTGNSDSRLSVDPDNANHYVSGVVALKAGEKIKVNNGGSDWYSNASTWENCGFSLDEEGNVVISAGGNYIVNFYVEGDNNNHIVPTAQQA